MPKIREKPNKSRRLWLLPIALLLAAVAVLTLAFWQARPAGLQLSSAGTVLVNDGVRTVRLVPWEGVPVSDLVAEAFSVEDDLVVYSGAARQGIDVSEHQGQIDWQQVARSGVTFAYLRVGYRGATEGQLHTDLWFEENLSGARAAGLDVGVYFFSQALDELEAMEEADYALAVLDGRKLDLPVMFDWEPVDKAGSRTGGGEARAVTDSAAAFCRRVAASGYEAGIYFNRQQGYYSYDLSQLKDFTFWVSDPNDSPDFYYAFRIWQYSFTGTVPGIDTVVDRNLLFEEGGTG